MIEFSETMLMKLVDAIKDDSECLDMIYKCVKSFEDYHSAIFEMELKLKIFTGMDDYRETASALDRSRTVNHNAVLANVNILNRMAGKLNIEPIYSGIVSEENPYRRDVANAVLAYVESIIQKRR